MGSWSADFLGPGFYSRSIDLPGEGPARLATLIRYVPQDDPLAHFPDRVVPTNLNGKEIVLNPGSSKRRFLVLPPAASPQPARDIVAFAAAARAGEVPARMLKHKDDSVQETPQADLDLLSEVSGCMQSFELSACAGLEVPQAPTFTMLYIHGWNDYFFQTHLAKVVAHLGGAFFALDLHHYGRSLDAAGARTPVLGGAYGQPARIEGQIDNCFEVDFANFAPEINAAWDIISQEYPGLVRLLFGHSQGGLLAATWAATGQRPLDGLVLNSPWLAQDWSVVKGGTLVRSLLPAVAALHPRGAVFQPPDPTYGISLDGYRAGSYRPKRLTPFISDPSVHGWFIHPRWKISPQCPMWLGSINAAIHAQAQVQKGLNLAIPVLAMTAPAQACPNLAAEVRNVDAANARSGYLTGQWSEACRHRDTVLNGELTARTAQQKLGSHVHLHTLGGLHDLTLSQPMERASVWAVLRDWCHTHFGSE